MDDGWGGSGLASFGPSFEAGVQLGCQGFAFFGIDTGIDQFRFDLGYGSLFFGKIIECRLGKGGFFLDRGLGLRRTYRKAYGFGEDLPIGFIGKGCRKPDLAIGKLILGGQDSLNEVGLSDVPFREIADGALANDMCSSLGEGGVDLGG